VEVSDRVNLAFWTIREKLKNFHLKKKQKRKTNKNFPFHLQRVNISKQRIDEFYLFCLFFLHEEKFKSYLIFSQPVE
jgi:hypothetical protein